MRRLTRDEIITRFSIHNGKYIYDNIKYVNKHTKIDILCPQHGVFSQSPNAHSKGHGCPTCGSISSVRNHKMSRAKQRPDLTHVNVPIGCMAVPVGIDGKYAVVDNDDYDMVMRYNWSLSNGYAFHDGIGMMHRLILNTPDHKETDHKDRDRLNNRRNNLRKCTSVQNSINKGVQSNNKSGYKGVSLEKRSGKWIARLNHNKKLVLNSYHSTKIEAAKAYDKKAVEIYGEFAFLNFKEETDEK